MPSFDGGDDAAWVGGPEEGLGIIVGLVDEAVDGGLELGDGAEDAALEPTPGKLGEKALDGVQPGARGGGEMEGPARMTAEPGADLGVLVGGVVVDNGVDDLAGRDGTVDGIEEADELLMPVALHVAADHLAVEHVERGKQSGRPMALVVVSHGPEPPRLHRQAGLRAVERLDLALFIDAEDHRVGRRIDPRVRPMAGPRTGSEADDVLHLVGERRITGSLNDRNRCGRS